VRRRVRVDPRLCEAHALCLDPASRVTINRLLGRMREVRISEDKHGPRGQRVYGYEPTFLLRGLTELHTEFVPAPRYPEPRHTN
jgi:hypothetical protein